MSPFRRNALLRMLRRDGVLDMPLKPGTVANVVAFHDEGCRKPQGQACTCKDGPTFEIVPNPEAN